MRQPERGTFHIVSVLSPVYSYIAPGLAPQKLPNILGLGNLRFHFRGKIEDNLRCGGGDMPKGEVVCGDEILHY